MKIIGHRGAQGLEPENTLRGFRRALKDGADVIEFDVQTLPSGKLVVFHDDKLDRTTNGRGQVMDYSFEKLRGLDAGQGEKIPTLKEALDVIIPSAIANIELKTSGTAEPVAKVIAQYRAKGLPAEKFFVSSYDLAELAKFYALMPEIKIASLFMRSKVHYLGLSGVVENIPYWRRFNTKHLLKKAHQNNQEFYIGSANKALTVKRMAKLGVDGIFTDYPNIAKEALSSS